MRFLVTGGAGYVGSLRELAEGLGISKERVRIIQRGAEEMLRTGEHGRLLRGIAA